MHLPVPIASSINFDIAKTKGLVQKIEKAGGLILRETCPEVVHYNHDEVKHILTNSMKAEHYLKSGLNAIDTSVSRLETCIKHAVNPDLLENTDKIKTNHKVIKHKTSKTYQKGNLQINGKGLESED